MRFCNNILGERRLYSQGDDLQSMVIDWMRFPMAIMVVFAHCSGMPADIDLDAMHADPLSGMSIYNFFRVIFSHVLMKVAVPSFFIFSGYLFFRKIDVWSKDVYVGRLVKRLRTLALPYILWITLYIIVMEGKRLGGILMNDAPGSDLWQFVVENGGWRMYWDCFTWGNGTNIFGYPVCSSGPILVPMWFIRDLLVLSVLTPIIYWLVRKLRIFYLLIVLICCFTDIWVNFLGLTIFSVLWFSIGAYFGINKLDMVVTARKFRTLSYLLFLITLFPLVWFGGSTASVGFDVILIFIISGIFVVINIFAWLIERQYVGLYPLFVKSAFFVYALHMFFQGRVMWASNTALASGNYVIMIVNYLATPFLLVLLCLILYVALRKFAPKLLALLTGDRG